jgi:hypothetical protein
MFASTKRGPAGLRAVGFDHDESNDLWGIESPGSDLGKFRVYVRPVGDECVVVIGTPAGVVSLRLPADKLWCGSWDDIAQRVARPADDGDGADSGA